MIQSKFMNSYLILHNIRSAENVGAIFRTADCAGVVKIYLVGYTPTPIDRFGRERKDIAKSALGAEKTIKWEQVSEHELSNMVGKLKSENCEVVALEQAKNSVDYKKHKSEKDFALIVGNEVDGLSDGVLKLCNKIIEIPMKGQKESLNVSVATGVALFRILGI